MRAKFTERINATVEKSSARDFLLWESELHRAKYARHVKLPLVALRDINKV